MNSQPDRRDRPNRYLGDRFRTEKGNLSLTHRQPDGIIHPLQPGARESAGVHRTSWPTPPSPCREPSAQGVPQGPPPCPRPRRGHASAAVTPAAQDAPFPVRPPRPRPPPARCRRPARSPAHEVLEHRALAGALAAHHGDLRQVQVAALADGAEGILQLVDQRDQLFHPAVAHGAGGPGPRAQRSPPAPGPRRCGPAASAAVAPRPPGPRRDARSRLGLTVAASSGSQATPDPSDLPPGPWGCAQSLRATPDWSAALSLVHTSQ